MTTEGLPAPETAPPLEPASRRILRGDGGTPVEVNARTWFLPDYVPTLGPVWDRLYDDNGLRGGYLLADLQLAAFRLFHHAYALTDAEAVGLVRAAGPADLVHAVEIALLGGNQNYHGYREYVRVTLWANAIDPAVIPPEMVRPVMDYLVRVGRALPPGAFISSVEAAAVRNSFAAFLRPKSAPAPEPASAPEPAPTPEPE